MLPLRLFSKPGQKSFALAASIAALGSLSPATAQEPSAELAAEMGAGFRVVESDHWRIVSDASPRSIAETAAVLERAHDQFYREWRPLGAAALRGKLTCVQFATAEGLAGYREKLGIASAPDGRGFYSLESRRIVLCDEDREPAEMVRVTARRPGATRKHSRTAHEAAHQLAFASGIQREGRPYPAWFAEGMAGNYEPATVTGAFGLSASARPDRLRALAVLRANDDLVPLAEFVALPHGAEIAGGAQVLYPQAAALFRFLFSERRKEFADYLAELDKLRLATAKPDHFHRAFTAAFGAIEDLEPEWQAYLDSLQAESANPRSKRRRGLF